MKKKTCFQGKSEKRLPGASLSIPMGPHFPSVSGFLAWKKVPIILIVPKVRIHGAVNKDI